MTDRHSVAGNDRDHEETGLASWQTSDEIRIFG